MTENAVSEENVGLIHKILVALGIRKNKKVIIRRDPLENVADIMVSEEAMEMVWFALKTCYPGTTLRWGKLVTVANRLIEPSDEEPDPIRLALTEETLKELLVKVFKTTESGSGEALELMRGHMPNFYDKHNLERAKKVSHFERNQRALTNECYSYGELEYEVFATIYAKVSRAYGVATEGFFADLGCGVGQLVFTAALVGDFTKVLGVEHVDALMERGSKRMVKWDMVQSRLPEAKRRIEFAWAGEDFTEKTRTWFDATFIFLHWTAFNNDSVRLISALMHQCKEGALVVSITRPLQNDRFEVLVQDKCKTSFGEVDFFVQEKLSPPSNRPEVDLLAEF
jgi:SAM-dependent methyltransferase